MNDSGRRLRAGPATRCSAVKGVTGKHVAPMKIAVFCPNLIGDTVMATPTFRAPASGSRMPG